MKRYLLVLVLAFIPLLNTVAVLSQDNTCTREGVATSYAQAVAAGTDLNQWYQITYANSGCPEEVVSFARSLANTQLPSNAPTSQSAQNDDDPPAGLKPPGPGTYLYTGGKLVRLSSNAGQDLSNLPQTSNVRPSILFWSNDTSNSSLFAVNTVAYITGGIGVTLASVAGHISISFVYPNTPAFNAGLQFGDRIVSVDGVQVGGVVDQTTKLLIGEIGTPVTIAVFRGTQSFTVSIVRGPSVTPQFSTWPYDAWDATTIRLKPDTPLPLGVYCVGDGCFKVVTVVTYVEVRATDVPQKAVDLSTLCDLAVQNLNPPKDGSVVVKNENWPENSQVVVGLILTNRTGSNKNIVVTRYISAGDKTSPTNAKILKVEIEKVTVTPNGMAATSVNCNNAVAYPK